MIRTLRLENYRGFETYELRDLARVNLLVGPNNCGKTSVLEAVELLVSRGDPSILIESARRRREFHVGEDGRRHTRYPLRHHFHGHEFGLGARLGISSDGGFGWVRMRIEEAEPSESEDLFEIISRTTQPLALRIERAHEESDIVVSLTEGGSLDRLSPTMPRMALGSSRLRLPQTQFVTAESLQAGDMAGVWNQVVVQGRESEVVEAMRILRGDLHSIQFLTGDASGRSGVAGGIFLGFRAGAPRVPIGSHGDGTRRLLALSLSLVRAADGFLLIDEIDTGLHWTVMEEVWKLVAEAAVKSSIQVFATTHSLDCIMGLASLLRNRPDLADAVSVQKIERELDHSVSFDAQATVAADDLSIELR